MCEKEEKGDRPCFFIRERYCPGVMPLMRRKSLTIWLQSVKPVFLQMVFRSRSV